MSVSLISLKFVQLMLDEDRADKSLCLQTEENDDTIRPATNNYIATHSLCDNGRKGAAFSATWESKLLKFRSRLRPEQMPRNEQRGDKTQTAI